MLISEYKRIEDKVFDQTLNAWMNSDDEWGLFIQKRINNKSWEIQQLREEIEAAFKAESPDRFYIERIKSQEAEVLDVEFETLKKISEKPLIRKS